MTHHKLSLLVLVALAACLASQVTATKDPKTLCYYESWVHWRTNTDGKMDPADIDYKLCSHMVYAYFGIEPSTHELKITDPYLSKDLHDLEKFVKAKGTSKAVIAVQSNEFAQTAASDSARTAFVDSVIKFLAQYSFDGVIVEWPSMQEKDAANLIALLDKFDSKLASTPYTLGISLSEAAAAHNDVPKISTYVDFIHVVSYDYLGSWAKNVGHAAPLSAQLATLEAFHKRGAPRSKLIMSVALYGQTWKLANAQKQEVGAEATSAGTAGPITNFPGKLGYNEICHMIKGNPSAFSLVRDPKEMAVHAVYLHGATAEWISFEDSKTLGDKAKFVTDEGYGGLAVHALSDEDSHGLCGKKYPLLSAIHDHYNHAAVTEKPVVTIPPAHFTTAPPVTWAGPHCTKEGKFRDHLYCSKYYVCEKGDLGFEMSEMHCERHQAFDEVTQKCVDEKTVPGCH